MAYDDEYKGMILGTRPGDDPNEPGYDFGADALKDYEDDMEEVDEITQIEENRLYHGRVDSSLNSIDGVGHVEKIHAHFDKAKGRYVTSYSDHLDVYLDKRSKLGYDPQQYQIFDGVINDYLKDSRRHDGINNPNNQFYNGYEPLRQNIAILRMSLYSVYFPDGEYNPSDPKDKAKIAKIQQISRKIGHELKWQSRWRFVVNMLTFNFSDNNISSKRFGKYGEEHFGAQKMYEMLYREQDKMSWNPIKWIMGTANKRDWGLPHPEMSPFCKQDMHEAVYNDNRDEELGIARAAPKLGEEAINIETIAAKLKSGIAMGTVAQMNGAKREESVELGREILRRLREISFGRSERALDGLNSERLDLEHANLVRGFAENYLELYNDLLARDPSIVNDSTFERARLAIGKLGHLSMLDARSNANKEERRELNAAYAELPKEYKQVNSDVEEDLIRDVEVAMNEIANRQNVAQKAVPQVRKTAKSAVMNMHNTMSNARFAAAPTNLINQARQVNAINEQRSVGNHVSDGGVAPDGLGAGYRA